MNFVIYQRIATSSNRMFHPQTHFGPKTFRPTRIYFLKKSAWECKDFFNLVLDVDLSQSNRWLDLFSCKTHKINLY